MLSKPVYLKYISLNSYNGIDQPLAGFFLSFLLMHVIYGFKVSMSHAVQRADKKGSWTQQKTLKQLVGNLPRHYRHLMFIKAIIY